MSGSISKTAPVSRKSEGAIGTDADHVANSADPFVETLE
jgi:hypothetical protein